MNAGQVDAAQRTLARAATFWTERAAVQAGWTEGSADAVRARYTGNCFRELDGFLRGLLDELTPAASGPRRNTVASLRARHGAAADCLRLHAIGRSTACLLHCAGWVRRPDERAGGWMTSGWPDADGAALRRYPLGDRLRPDGGDVADVCGFYRRVGEAVVG